MLPASSVKAEVHIERGEKRCHVRWPKADIGYQVIPPPIGVIVTSLPDGAVAENIKSTAYFHFGGVYHRPFYSGSSVIYEVVAKPG